MSKYNNYFYKKYDKDVLNSARAIVPIVLDLINPQSVVDWGCGIGTWLSVFKKSGIQDVCGYDGQWVENVNNYFEKDGFTPLDFSNISYKIKLDRKYDLAICLEVAEHLSEEKAFDFIKMITGSSDVVLFSAAIPFQGGTDHVNEQWPEYWASLFKQNGFVVFDCIRKEIWNNKTVKWWYAQNIFLYVRKTKIVNYSLLNKVQDNNLNQLSIVHPNLYQKYSNYKIASLRRIFVLLLKIIVFRLKSILNFKK